jgi:hypothetical protein
MKHKYFTWFHDYGQDMQRHLHGYHQRLAHKRLMCFRLHSWKLQCHLDHTIPRLDRHCKECTQNQIEDEFHVVFDCPCYTNIRSDYNHLFQNNVGDLKAFMNQDRQSDVMLFLAQVHKARFGT